MTEWFVAVVLGIVEGLSEFLPISSTGHLIIVGHLLGFTGLKAEIFEVVIQLGAILAVVQLYRHRFAGLLRHDPKHAFSGIRGLCMLALTCFPASLLGLLTHEYIKTSLFGPSTVALALAVGAIMILIVEHFVKSSKTHRVDHLSLMQALGIGCFQCLALWPGFSRSAATIMGGMILGASRSVAAEYSFIAAVPIMIMATTFDMVQNYHLLTRNDLLFIGIGFLVSYAAALFAIKSFLYILRKTTLKPFAWYRLAVAPLIYFFWAD